MNMDVLSKVRNRGFVDPSGKVAPDRYFNCPIHEQQGTDHYLAGVVSKARSAIGTELFFFLFRFVSAPAKNIIQVRPSNARSLLRFRTHEKGY